MNTIAIAVVVSGVSLSSLARGQSGIITTVAGNGMSSSSGDGGLATSAGMAPESVAVDASGNLFIVDFQRIRKVSVGGLIETVAGNGTAGFSGDGGPATSALLNDPSYVAVDASGNIFFSDTRNNRVRKVSASGVITTVAGNGTAGFSGDGGPAASASLDFPLGVVVDASGNLFIADARNYCVRKVSASGIISTVAGNGIQGISGDGGPATSASFYNVNVIALDVSGNLFVADAFSVRKVSAGGIISTATYVGPSLGMAVDASGNLLIAHSSLIEKLSASGVITTVVGNLISPQGIALDTFGNLFIADAGVYRILEVFAQAPSFTVSPASISLSLTVGALSSQQINLASPAAGLAWTASTSASWITLTPTTGTAPGTITVAINTVSLQPGAYSASITILNPGASPPQESVGVSLTVTAPTATITIAPAALNFQIQQGGTSQSQSIQIAGTAGTMWQATATTSAGGAWLSVSSGSGQIPASLTVVAIWSNQAPGTYQGSITFQAPATPSSTTISVAFTVTTGGGIITTVAGNGMSGFSGDGGPATSAELEFVGGADPAGLAVDASGNLFIADYGNARIRKVSPSGIITTFAQLGLTPGVAVDASGNVVIAVGATIQKVSPTGVVTTVAGNGTDGFSGDGGPATSASLGSQLGVAVDASGNLFIADSTNNRIRKVSPSGIITTVAGNGIGYYSGDGGPATSASLADPKSVAVDASGNLFIADTSNYAVRRVSSSGIITSISGGQVPYSVAVDASGNLFVAYRDSGLIQKVSPSGIITTVAGGGTVAGDGGLATSAALGLTIGVAVDASGNIFLSEQRGDYGPSDVRKVTPSTSTSSLPSPSITSGGVVPAGSKVSTIQPGEWVSIYGTNLASSAVTWNGNFPTSLGGTSVTINGKAAYLSYVSPTQINLQAPNDTATATVPVVVTTATGTASSTVTLAQWAPSMLLLDSKHVAGIILRSNGSGAYGGGSYDILGPTGNSLGYATVAAKAGDTIALYAVGLGPTAPAVPAGQAFSGSAPTTYPVNLLINKGTVTPTFAGLSSAGLYQINLTIPSGLGTGDVSLVATVGGAQTLSNVVVSLQ